MLSTNKIKSEKFWCVESSGAPNLSAQAGKLDGPCGLLEGPSSSSEGFSGL